MFNLKVKNHRGDIYEFTNCENEYVIVSMDGLASSEVVVNSSVVGDFDGQRVNSARVEARMLLMGIAIRGDVAKNRMRLYHYFPLREEITIYFKNENRDVFLKGHVENIEIDLYENPQTAKISILCGDPFYKAVTELLTSFSEAIALFEFPFAIENDAPISLSELDASDRRTLTNNGDTTCGMLIHIRARATVVDPEIVSVTTGQRIQVKMTLNFGDQLLINTNRGQKSVQYIAYGTTVPTNAIGKIDPTSDFPELLIGDNIIAFSPLASIDDVVVQITFNERYVGI